MRRPLLLALAVAACGVEPEPLLLEADESRLPPGEQTVERAILLQSGGALVGSGPGRTILKAGSDLVGVVRNADQEGGNSRILLADLTIDCAGKADFGAFFVRTENLVVRNVELKGCRRDGARISGNGQHTRGAFLSDIETHDNRADGLIVMWAMRDVAYTNIRAYRNGRNGVTFDHSELVATNIIARENKGDGIFLRNLFATAFTNLAATRNGHHGIFIQGWVASTGSTWRSQSNSVSAKGKFDDIRFTAADHLSYGATRDSVLSGVVAGGYEEIVPEPTARHALAIDAGATPVVEGVVYGPTIAAARCAPCQSADD